MKRIVVLLILLGLVSWAQADDGWKWKPEGTSAIRPVGDKVTEREYPMPAGGALPIIEMFGTITNTGATGTVEINLSAPTGMRSFTVEAWAAQMIEVDFPAGANPYLDGVQVGADNEIDVPAGAVLLVTYRPASGTWHCDRVVGLPTDGNADD